MIDWLADSLDKNALYSNLCSFISTCYCNVLLCVTLIITFFFNVKKPFKFILLSINVCVDCLLNYNIIMQWNITSCRNIHNWSTLLYDLTIWTCRCPVKDYTNHTCTHIWKICSSKVTLNVGKKRALQKTSNVWLWSKLKLSSGKLKLSIGKLNYKWKNYYVDLL